MNRFFCFILYALIALLWTWPLAANLTSAIPLGTEKSASVPLFNLWIMRWNADRILHHYEDYWNAPIFHPYENSFALSDPQPLTGLIFAVLQALTGNNNIAYNVIIILTLALNGYAGFYFLTTIGIPAVASTFGGIFAVTLPFVSNELGVLQLTAIWPVFFSLSFLYLFLKTNSVRAALILGVWFLITYFTSIYYAIFLSLCIILGVAFCYRKIAIRDLIPGLLGALLTLFALFPFLITVHSASKENPRSENTIYATSAQLFEYAQLNPIFYGSSIIPWINSTPLTAQQLYPGTILLLLVSIALFSKKTYQSQFDKAWFRFMLAGLVTFFLLSFGLRLNIFDFQPYQFLRDFYPGINNLRNSFRFSVFVQIFAVGLSGYALAKVSTTKVRIWFAGSLVCLSMLELSPIPLQLHLTEAEQKTHSWAAELKNYEPGPVALLPFPEGHGSRHYHDTILTMHALLDTRYPLLNGYSGLFPASFMQLKLLTQSFPSNEAISALAQYGAKYLVVDKSLGTQISGSTKIGSSKLSLLFETSNKRIYQMINDTSSS